jgi:hypothetical protein
MKYDDPQQPGAGPARERLDSWKEIAAYLKREVRTVQRWEKSEGLPVRRHLHKKQGTIYAYKSELDAWWSQRGMQESTATQPEASVETAEAPQESLSWSATMEAEPVAPVAAKWHWLPRMATPRHALAALLLMGAVGLLLHVATPSDEGRAVVARTPALAAPVGSEPPQPARTAIATPGNQRVEVPPSNAQTPPPTLAQTQREAQPAQTQAQAQPPQVENERGGQGWLQSLAAEISRGGRKVIDDTASLWKENVKAGHPQAAMVRWSASSGLARRILDSGGLDHGPQFSPDGRRIVFASDRSGSREIWVADADGRNSVQLTRMGVFLTGTPRWSPDGRRIVFDSYPDGPGDIFVVSANGGGLKRITNAPSSEAVPSWSPDGRWIYFASDRTGEWQVWKIEAGGGKEVQVTRRGGFAAFESYDGKSVYYARYDQAGVWTVPVEGGEETLVLDQLQAGLWGYWAVASDGIYFAEMPAPAKGGERARMRIRFFSFDSRAFSTVAELEGHPVEWDPGLAVSPNRQTILYARLREPEPER